MRAILFLIPVALACGSAETEMQEQIEAARKDRVEVKRAYGALFDQVSALLFADDPVGINFDSNTDEYEAEAGTIIPRLSSCRSSSDVQRVIHEEFVRWFGSETAGPPERYALVAEQIWSAWRVHHVPE